MCGFLSFSYKIKGPWQSGYIKPKKKYYCDYCEKVKSRKLCYRWIDGLRSCYDCNMMFKDD
ncbi:MAG: hypothetical protein AABY22_07785 [Nanoarchaeota archaeon]